MPGGDISKTETVHQFLNYTRQTPTSCSILVCLPRRLHQPPLCLPPRNKRITPNMASYMATPFRCCSRCGVPFFFLLSMRLPSAHPISESLETNADTLQRKRARSPDYNSRPSQAVIREGAIFSACLCVQYRYACLVCV